MEEGYSKDGRYTRRWAGADNFFESNWIMLFASSPLPALRHLSLPEWRCLLKRRRLVRSGINGAAEEAV